MNNERGGAKEWLKDKQFRTGYGTLEAEFALASARIEARSQTGMTQKQVAKAMGIRLHLFRARQEAL